MMEKEDYVSLETAKMLKEKGYDEMTSTFYGSKRGFSRGDFLSYNRINGSAYFLDDTFHIEFERAIAAPTLYEAQKWLLTSKGIFVHPIIYTNDKFGFMVKGVGVFSKINSEFIMPYYSTFQQALDAGIREALKLI